MSKADKRARKRENQNKAKIMREAEAKRAKRNRGLKIGAGIAVVIVSIVGLATAFGGDDKKTTEPTTTTPSTTSTTKLPDGCVDTKPAKAGNGKTYNAAPPMTIDPARTYTATFETSCGKFTAELDAKNSPKGTNQFVFLAREGFYDGLTWHRAVNNFVIQGGDPQGTGTGGAGYSVVTEWPKQDFKTGDLAWAKSPNEAAGTAGSQFFVTTGDPAALNGTKKGDQYDYGYFGRVTSGLENAKKMEGLAPATPEGGTPTQPIYILKVTITES